MVGFIVVVVVVVVVDVVVVVVGVVTSTSSSVVADGSSVAAGVSVDQPLVVERSSPDGVDSDTFPLPSVFTGAGKLMPTGSFANSSSSTTVSSHAEQPFSGLLVRQPS